MIGRHNYRVETPRVRLELGACSPKKMFLNLESRERHFMPFGKYITELKAENDMQYITVDNKFHADLSGFLLILHMILMNFCPACKLSSIW
jgi:hypothetical protein